MPFPTPLLLALTSEPARVERGVAPAALVTFFTTSTWLALVASQKEHAPKVCRVCRSNALDEGARKALVWERRKLADTLSNVGLAVTPGWALGSLLISGAADKRRSAVDPLLVVESTMTAMLINQIVKFEVARERPDVHHGLVAHGGSEDNVSFFSGHTTWSFASAVAAGSVASLRGYRGAPAVWAGGLAFAAATGALRIGADRHWLSDVLVGAVIGSAAGALIPRLHLVRASTTSVATSQAAVAPTWITVGGVF
jgi:membrane-associated phospholipid phosphatase